MQDDDAEVDPGPVDWNKMMKSLGRVVRPLLPNPQDRLDAIGSAHLRYFEAVASGVKIRSDLAFLMNAVRQEAVTLSRSKRRRANREVMASDLADADGTLPEATADPARPVDQSFLDAVRSRLSPSHRVWLDDLLSGQPDSVLAARDGIDEATIRQRRSRLENLLCSERFLAFVDFLGHNRGR